MTTIDPCFGPGVSAVAVPMSHADATASPRVHRLWSLGQDDRIAAGYREEAEAFVGRLRLAPGVRVLDAACGSGSATVPAAHAGADVTGVDLVAGALHMASARAAAEDIAVTLEQASVEALPYADASFDVVLSLFGVMFAARPDRVLAELARVTRPGGRVVLASWTGSGFMGALHAVLVGPIAITFDLPDPMRWGDADAVRDWLDDGNWDVRTEARTAILRYPHTPAGTAELFRIAYPPAVRAFEMLRENNRAVLAGELAALWTRHCRSDATRTEVGAEYLEVTAVRR